MAAMSHSLPLSRDRLHDGLFESLRGRGRIRRLEPRHILFPEGQRPSLLSVVEAGVLSLSVTTMAGARVVLAVVGRGDLVGEQALPVADGDPEEEPLLLPECRAVTPSRVLDLSPSDVGDGLAQHTDLAGWLTACLARRIAELHRSLARVLSLPLEERTLDLLTTLSRRRWGGRAELASTGVPLTQEDLAAMLGATRESVNRALRQLERAGAVTRVGRRYRVGLAPRMGVDPPPGRTVRRAPGPPFPPVRA